MSHAERLSDERPDDDAMAPAEQAWAPIDLLLQQGDADEIARMRREVCQDPMLALELADTVALVEQLRHVRTDASPEFAGKMADVIVRADRRLSGRDRPYGRPRHLPLIACAAAAATFALLWWLDPGARLRGRVAVAASPVFELGAQDPSRDPSREERASDPAAAGTLASAAGGRPSRLEQPLPATESEQPRILDYSEAAWATAVEQVRERLELESLPHMRDAFEAGLRDARDPLSLWLDPRNSLVMLRLDHELRASADVRTRALMRSGSLPAVDTRVQELADAIADDLLAGDHEFEGSEFEGSEVSLAETAWGMRALIGAGSTVKRSRALQRSGARLAARLPVLHGEQLVLALSGMVELAAITGQHFQVVTEHGARLIDEVLQPDDDNWSRRRPELLNGRIAAGTIGEAGRILRRLPAFGADAGRCQLVRQLLLGQLRERRAVGQDRPEVLAAMLYGSGELLDDAERGAIELRLRRWRPIHLAPDFATVQQLAWSMPPGHRGFARLQGELRQLAVLPIPDGLCARAAFCLCLATNYAGFVGGLLPPERPLRDS